MIDIHHYDYSYGLPYWALFWLLVIVAFCLIVTIWLKVDAKSKTVQKEAALIARAESQHRALMDGNDWGGVYGQYPPAKL